jgi:hypothetical protein
MEDAQCSMTASTATGRVTPDALTLEISNVRMRISGTLPRAR